MSVRKTERENEGDRVIRVVVKSQGEVRSRNSSTTTYSELQKRREGPHVVSRVYILS